MLLHQLVFWLWQVMPCMLYRWLEVMCASNQKRTKVAPSVTLSALTIAHAIAVHREHELAVSCSSVQISAPVFR